MSFKPWKNYFEANQNHFDWLRLNGKRELNDNERKLIHDTIQQFQKGEYSEGKNLFRNSFQMKDTDYTEAIKLFIREEQQHAIALGEFMAQEGIPKIKTHWIDEVFRGLRKIAGLQISVAVLLTAEVIAAVFYKALARATGSVTLGKICRQILKDEDMHLQFQSLALGKLDERNFWFQKITLRIFRHLLMRGTIFVVWFTQQKVLSAGGYSFSRFYDETMSVFLQTEAFMLSAGLPKTAPGYYGI